MTGENFKITVLVEDSTSSEKLIAEHGWSVLIESAGTSGLFDTGQTYDVILRNAQCLGVDLSCLSWIVLSHGHYDHTGGLKAVLDTAKAPEVFAHPDIFADKYVRESNGKWRSAGIPITRGEIERTGAGLRCASEAVEVASGIMTTGEISRGTDFESVGDAFFMESNGEKTPDLFADDQALVLRTQKGLVVLLGCAHAGVVNTLRHVATMTGEEKIHAVIGGMHLGGVSRDRILKTMDAFDEYKVDRIGLAHCTGRNAENEFFAAFGKRCFVCPVGSVIEF